MSLCIPFFLHFFLSYNFSSFCYCQLTLQTNEQVLLIHDGKLYGRDPVFTVISKAAALPEFPKDHEIQKNEVLAQLGQVKKSSYLMYPFLDMHLN